MKSARIWAWIVFALGAAYFLLPLIATFEFSLRIRREGYTFDAYANVFSDPAFQATFGYSLLVGLMTIVVGILIVVPAAYFVRLKLPWLRPIIGVNLYFRALALMTLSNALTSAIRMSADCFI
jgi:putative spermidine/putrescine transport system permease protein